MLSEKKKLIIYQRSRKTIDERRKLTKQCFELKEKFDYIEKNDLYRSSNTKPILPILARERASQQDYYFKKNGFQYCYSFTRVTRRINLIFKRSSVPLNSWHILKKLAHDYELITTQKNLAYSIFSKMNEECSIPFKRVCRRHWQYKFLYEEGATVND